MPFPLGTVQEISKLDTCYRANDLVLRTFGFKSNSFGARNLGSFQADQNYSLRKIAMAITGNADQNENSSGAIAGVCWGRTSADFPTMSASASADTFTSSTAMACLMLSNRYFNAASVAVQNMPDPAVSEIFDFTPDNVYLPKGMTIYLNALISAAAGGQEAFLFGVTTLYLKPTFA